MVSRRTANLQAYRSPTHCCTAVEANCQLTDTKATNTSSDAVVNQGTTNTLSTWCAVSKRSRGSPLKQQGSKTRQKIAPNVPNSMAKRWGWHYCQGSADSATLTGKSWARGWKTHYKSPFSIAMLNYQRVSKFQETSIFVWKFREKNNKSSGWSSLSHCEGILKNPTLLKMVYGLGFTKKYHFEHFHFMRFYRYPPISGRAFIPKKYHILKCDVHPGE